ncbi:LptE family protein [Aureivirga marina]|uniref:LptE family protein n=1 Tax=Aureivirga marina TaxID=1182451 RepID=UPI0018C97AC9|nr:LptE family protein [Aureivirga marina]
MRILKQISVLVVLCAITISCGVYSFTGANTNAKSVQINFFPNNAPLVEPTLSQEFTLALQDLFLSQTNLSLVKTGGELVIDGEITGYRITPMSATANQTAAQNRLTITVNVRFYNTLDENDDFERNFSFFYDYPADRQLVGSTLADAYQVIFERITQDIFNATVAKW